MAGTNVLQSFFDNLISRIPGLHAVLVTDADGVALVQASSASYTESGPDVSLAALFAVAAGQVGKLQFGANRSVTSFFEDRTIVHLNATPVYVSMIGAADANVGLMTQVAPEILQALDPLREQLRKDEDGQ